MKLALTMNGITTTIEANNDDQTLTEMFNTFRVLLIAATYSTEQIDVYLGGYDE